MKTRLRTQQIYIDLPTPESEPWLNIIVQRVEMDDNYQTKNIVDRWGAVNERLSKIAMNVYPYTDLLQPPQGYISVAGLGEALTIAAMDLIIKKYGGTIDEHGFIMVS
jgi:hypothetical protein